MEIVGSILKSLPSQSGTSQAGKDWIKRQIIIQTQGQYPKDVVITINGDKGDVLKNFKKGQLIRVQFDLSSREYKEKWYTDVIGFKIEAADDAPAPAKARTATSPHRQPERAETERAWENDDDQGDLPF